MDGGGGVMLFTSLGFIHQLVQLASMNGMQQLLSILPSKASTAYAIY